MVPEISNQIAIRHDQSPNSTYTPDLCLQTHTSNGNKNISNMRIIARQCLVIFYDVERSVVLYYLSDITPRIS